MQVDSIEIHMKDVVLQFYYNKINFIHELITALYNFFTFTTTSYD
jgi:hypothetical protein